MWARKLNEERLCFFLHNRSLMDKVDKGRLCGIKTSEDQRRSGRSSAQRAAPQDFLKEPQIQTHVSVLKFRLSNLLRQFKDNATKHEGDACKLLILKKAIKTSLSGGYVSFIQCLETRLCPKFLPRLLNE